MSEGFFIDITRHKQKNADERWTADHIKPIAGWSPSKGKDLEEVIKLQREQYHKNKAANAPVPDLTHTSQGPMASGKVTRFVEIEE
jgi:hypothetical protein